MNKVEKTVLVPHSTAEMFMLVDKVEDYPTFLPWCGGVDLLARTESITSATLHINFRGVKQNFTTENAKIFTEKMVITLVNGPFKSLNGQWHFIELNKNSCKIEFELNYEFANSFLEKLISPIFSHIASTFVDSFVQQADKVYKQEKS